VADASAAAEYAEGALEEGDVVLVKGSRSVGLELIADQLRITLTDDAAGD